MSVRAARQGSIRTRPDTSINSAYHRFIRRAHGALPPCGGVAINVLCINTHYVIALHFSVCIDTHMKSADVIKALKANGWEQVRQRGSHCQFRKPGNPSLVTVPHPKRDLPIGTLRSIEKASGLTFG